MACADFYDSNGSASAGCQRIERKIFHTAHSSKKHTLPVAVARCVKSFEYTYTSQVSWWVIIPPMSSLMQAGGDTHKHKHTKKNCMSDTRAYTVMLIDRSTSLHAAAQWSTSWRENLGHGAIIYIPVASPSSTTQYSITCAVAGFFTVSLFFHSRPLLTCNSLLCLLASQDCWTDRQLWLWPLWKSKVHFQEY